MTGARALAFPDLYAALAAVVVLALGAAGISVAGHAASRQSVHAIAPELFPAKNRGMLLQREAFRHHDLLPFYGSSELVREIPNRAADFFHDNPRGFDLFPVGDQGQPLLVTVQSLAAAGDALRGKKVVISVSPTLLLEAESPRRKAKYAGNFSRLQARALALSEDLDDSFKRAAAGRMLGYPGTLQGDPVLRAVLLALADSTLLGRARYDALVPWEHLELLLLQVDDAAQVLWHLRGRHDQDTAAPRTGPEPDWRALEASAEREALARAGGSQFGMDAARLKEMRPGRLQAAEGSWSDVRFRRAMAKAESWGDLDLLLSGLDRLGARPLILSMPLHGAYFDYLGVSRAARREFYARLEGLAAAHGTPLLDFAEHDEDRTFLVDEMDHLGPRGWVFFNRAIDAFFHDTLR